MNTRKVKKFYSRDAWIHLGTAETYVLPPIAPDAPLYVRRVRLNMPYPGVLIVNYGTLIHNVDACHFSHGKGMPVTLHLRAGEDENRFIITHTGIVAGLGCFVYPLSLVLSGVRES